MGGHLDVAGRTGPNELETEKAAEIRREWGAAPRRGARALPDVPRNRSTDVKESHC